MSNAFEFYAPTKVIFGEGTEARVAEQIRAFGGTKVLLHYGGKSAERSGLIDRVKSYLEKEGLSYVTLGGVVPNPHLSKVREGIELCRNEGVDFLLAVGGGSVIDSCKAIGYALANPDTDVWDFYLGKTMPTACLPLGSILTIAAAGSEMSNSSVITNEETQEKRSCNTNYARAKFAIMDPALTLTLPDYQTMSGCVDIMMHTMERYFTNGGNMELTDEISEGLLRTVKKHAVILHNDPQNVDSRAEVMWASSLAHNDLTGCGVVGRGDFTSHKLEHELGGFFDVTHGAGLAAVWPSWARYVYKDCLHRFVRFAHEVMAVPEGKSDEDTALAGIEAMEDFYRSINMPVNMTELLGFTPSDEDIKKMAASCYAGIGRPSGNAKSLVEEDFVAIYQMAKG